LHDIGKIGVPDAILNKAGILTEEERQRMMEHPEVGLRIAQQVDILKPAIPYIASHHERYDGRGYPQGLKGENIPIEGRLLAVVDTFDAVLSDRPYRNGASLEVAVSELVTHAGTQFDPRLVGAFLDVLRSGAVDLQEMYNRGDDLSCLDRLVVTETEPA
jgi:HD-GYP domain-containing protein (c-di-GMP phosphodiesterase class II)